MSGLTTQRWLRAYKPKPSPDAGRTLCIWCKAKPIARGGLRKYCSPECKREFGIRNGPRTLRRYLIERDRGICACCGFDGASFDNKINRLPNADCAELEILCEPYPRGGYIKPWEFMRSSWVAAHIIPVKKGGGLAGLDNYLTLCIQCHVEYDRLRVPGSGEPDDRLQIMRKNPKYLTRTIPIDNRAITMNWYRRKMSNSK